jgi:nitrogen regulatory protein PII
MKLITAIIKPHCLDAVRAGLIDVGVSGMTISEVEGFGRQKGHVELYRGSEYEVLSVAKIKIELVIDDDDVDIATESIVKNARTGKIGDGKIFITNVEEIIRIRTGETGKDAV